MEESLRTQKREKCPTVFKIYPKSQWRCDDLDENYGKFVEIGSGTYGCVYKAQNKRTGKIVAIKKMSYLEENKYEEGFPITTIRQIKLLQNLNHPQILGINQVLTKRVKDSFPVVHICLDYMDFDLDRFVQEKQFEMGIPQIKYIMKQLLIGLEYLHNNDVVHRDIKPKNILVNKEGDIKIADFGLAKNIKNRLFLTVKVVTLWYRAPQLLLGLRNYSSKIDMWSLGCLMAELMIRKPLFYYQQNQREMINKIYDLCGTPDINDWQEQIQDLDWYKSAKPPISKQNTIIQQLKTLCPTFASDNLLFNLLSRLLELNPYNRISATDALAHSFFKQGMITPEEFVTSETVEILNSKSYKKSSEADPYQKKYKN